MEFINKINIDFMSRRWMAAGFSAILLFIAIASLATRGLNFGVDFTGGYLIEVGYDEPAELNAVRQVLSDNGVQGAIVQHFGTTKEVLIRLPSETSEVVTAESSAEVSDSILKILMQQQEGIEMRRVEYVGPQVGEELKNEGGMAVLVALMCIMIYIMIRFEWKFSVGAVAALAHDVLITLGLFSVIQADFDLTVLAALLAVIGYSLNDTIVVFDRIRENFRRVRKGTPAEIINESINQTLARTLMTSGTTLLVLFALFFLGGEIIHSFALALIAGIVIGTYSSIFVASPLVLGLGLKREDMLLVKKEDTGLDHLP